MKIFFDTEFTGLHKKTSLVSIGIITEEGVKFYAELCDFDESQVNPWLQENVINNLQLQNSREGITRYNEHTNETLHFGDKASLKNELGKWLSQFGDIEVWSDCLHYDWVLFIDIFGTAFDVPRNVHYIPFDICTLFKLKGIDPDINREAYSGIAGVKHNALHDAKIIRACYNKLKNEK